MPVPRKSLLFFLIIWLSYLLRAGPSAEELFPILFQTVETRTDFLS